MSHLTYPTWQINRDDPFESRLSEPLWKIPESPESFYVQGQPEALELLKKLPDSGLAVVGTRKPQERSLILVRQWLHQMAGSNLIILSGLASGIDSAAHKAALEADLKTIAVLGNGFNFNYPSENTNLRQRILEKGGLIVSELPPQAPPMKHHFLKRNRIIAGWSKATWVVEAAHRSGALNTARWAREQDRACFAVPGYPRDPRLAGNQTLLDRDHAIPTWGVHSFGAAWLDLATHTPPKQRKTASSDPVSGLLLLNPDQQTLFHHLQQLTLQENGAQIQDLLEWSLAKAWNQKRFFSAFRVLTQQKMIYEKFGTWFC